MAARQKKKAVKVVKTAKQPSKVQLSGQIADLTSDIRWAIGDLRSIVDIMNNVIDAFKSAVGDDDQPSEDDEDTDRIA